MNFDNIKRLHDLGLALHWLHKKSKAPVNSAWTKTDRLSFDALKKSYKPGLNLGTVLGAKSKIEGGYLAVIDLDIKSKDYKHKLEALDKLEELFPSIHDKAPCVESGRGNGSGHFYIRMKDLVPLQKIAQSKDVVKVHMPSVAAPKKEDLRITKEELDKGLRLRPAWEIDFLSTGRQVVLPPSIHPDTGKPYVWVRDILKVGSHVYAPDLSFLAGLDPVKGPKVENSKDHGKLFQGEFIDVSWKRLEALGDYVNELLFEGSAEDGSAACLVVAKAMVRHKFTDDEIISVLTDPENSLGEVSYRHAGNTKNRRRAGQWIRDYTLGKARIGGTATAIFGGEYVEKKLSEEEAAAQEEEIRGEFTGEFRWEDSLERQPSKHGLGRILPTHKNIKRIIENVAPDAVKRNLFTNRDSYSVAPPWRADLRRAINEDDFLSIKDYFSFKWGFEPSVNAILETVRLMAGENAYHPVRDYLDGLEWDGVPRLDTWLKRAINADAPEPYLSQVSRKVVLAMVARVYSPGTKFDSVLILEGKQGVGKSSLGRILVGDSWYMDSLPDLRDKDAALNLQGNLLVELSELASLRKAEAEVTKSFISRQVDKVRPPYGKTMEEYPRQCIFIGTTNEASYLKDSTGNRRYWPVKVGKCDFKWLEKNKHQIFAEAKYFYDQGGEDLFLSGEALVQSTESQIDKMEDTLYDIMEDEFDRFKKSKEGAEMLAGFFTLSRVFGTGGAFSHRPEKNPYFTYASRVLRNRGYHQVRKENKRGWELTDKPGEP